MFSCFFLLLFLFYFMFLIIMYNLISLCIFLLSSRKQSYSRKHNSSRKHMSYTVDCVIDIIENNRPKPRSCVKFPCGICNKSVKNNHKVIQCDSCDLWIHIVCNDISDAEYECLKTEDDPWYCLVCFLKYNLNNVPFTRCDNSELNNINTSNSMRFLESLPNVEIANETSQFSNVSSNEASMEIPSKSCSN